MRAIFAALTISSLSSAAMAQQWDAFDACATNKDASARLGCFDQAVATRNAARAAPTAAAPAAAAPATAAPVATVPAAAAPVVAAPVLAAAAARPTPAPVGDSGRVTEPPLPAPFVATIVRIIPRTPLISAFELSNGQTWEQTESANFAAEPQQAVTIRHGALGAFFLKNAAGVSVRVRRVK
jgi:hypothetical protein